MVKLSTTDFQFERIVSDIVTTKLFLLIIQKKFNIAFLEVVQNYPAGYFNAGKEMANDEDGRS